MDKDGKLSEEDKQKIAAWLEERWPQANQHCPVCNDSTWIVADHVVMPLTVGPGGWKPGRPGYPQVMLISMNCAYTRFFNAALMGIKIEAEQPPEAPVQEQKKAEGG